MQKLAIKPRQWIASNFASAIGAPVAHIVHVSVPRLISIVDCDHAPRAQYAIVSKRADEGYATTVLDIPRKRVYRAAHDAGMAPFWKSLAAKRSANVRYLTAAEALPLTATVTARIGAPA